MIRKEKRKNESVGITSWHGPPLNSLRTLKNTICTLTCVVELIERKHPVVRCGCWGRSCGTIRGYTMVTGEMEGE